MMKTIKKILPAPPSHWVGDGFHVYPVFHNLAFTNELSPFLMLDYAAPKHFQPTQKKLGVGQHPHRGFETVTIAFQGEVEHGDSRGNHGIIGAGDLQWMTAASGIIHEEYHSRNFAKNGGTFEMVQLWVNLPAKYKMVQPRYQPILSKEIPVVELADGAGNARIIAGEFDGVKGKASTFSPVNLWDITLKPGSTSEFHIPDSHNAIVFVRRGNVEVRSELKNEVIGKAQVALMSTEGSKIVLKASEQEKDDIQLLLLGGEPLNEPIANRGPFVMNTQQELKQAMEDFYNGDLA